MNEDILKMMEERSKLKEYGKDIEYDRKDKEIKNACRAAKDKWFNELCEEMMQLEKNNNAKELHTKQREQRRRRLDYNHASKIKMGISCSKLITLMIDGKNTQKTSMMMKTGGMTL